MIEQVNIKELENFQGNLKELQESEFKKLSKSIEKYGFKIPIFVWNNKILDGHQRVFVLKKQGYNGTIPVVRLEAKNIKEAKELILLINSRYGKITDEGLYEFIETGDLDFDELKELVDLPEIDLEDFEMGYYKDDVPGVGEDEIPEDVEAITKLGDLYQLGNHRLLCGDSTNVKDVEKLTDGKKANVIVFDPPYDVESLYDSIPKPQQSQKIIIMWDFKRFAIAPAKAIEKGWVPQYELIWDCVQSWYTPNRPLAKHKTAGIFGEDPFFNTEKAIINDGKTRTAKTVSNTRGKCEYKPLRESKHIATVEQFPNTQQNDEHGHGKPIKWITAIFEGVGGINYLDLFAGSGSSIIACEKTKRNCYCMEIDPHYCDVIVQRYKDYCSKNDIKIEIKLNGVSI